MTLALKPPKVFRHEALLYAGDQDFVRKTAAFITDAVEAAEPILVVVGARKIDWLRQELGPLAAHVRFADMADVGLNPARIIPAWREFVNEQSARSPTRFRGIGEPIWADRTPDQLVEYQRHEALMNVAFDGAPAWWLVCPYDTQSLAPDVVDEAFRTHPLVMSGVETVSSDTFTDIEATARPFAVPLPEPDTICDEFVVDLDHLDATRRRVARRAISFGVHPARIGDLMLAASEVATNSLRYGGGRALARVWTSGDSIICEFRDEGVIDLALAGRVRPTPGQLRGYGLWLANQLCDLVQIRTFESGSVVRLHVSRAH